MRRAAGKTAAPRNRPSDHRGLGWLQVPVRIILGRDSLTDFQGRVVGFDRSWAKVRVDEKKFRPREGMGIGLQFGPGGRDAMPAVQGIVWHVEPDGVTTVLLSLSTQEYDRLKGLAAREVNARVASRKASPPPSWLDWRPQTTEHSTWAPPPPVPKAPPAAAPEESVEARPAPVESADAERAEPVASSPPTPEEGAEAAPLEPPAETSQPDPLQQAATWAQFLYEALRSQPENASLWCALGVAMYRLEKHKAAAEILQHVVGHAPPGSREVRVARSWLRRLGAVAEEAKERPRPEPAVAPTAATRKVEPPAEVRRAPSDPSPADQAAPPAPRPAEHPGRPAADPAPRAAGTRVHDEFGYFDVSDAPSTPPPPQPRAKRSSAAAPPPAPQGAVRGAAAARRARASSRPGEQAAILAAQGKYAEAAKLYAEACRLTPEKASLWYALGVTLRHLNRPLEAAEALQRVIRHGEPESLVRLARLWLERDRLGAERRPGGSKNRA